MKYAEKLLDPRWQKMRLKIMERAGFACEMCGETSQTLHVHHKLYIKDRAPWDYKEAHLACLCSNCHVLVHEDTPLLEDLVARLPYDGPSNIAHATAILAGLLAIGKDNLLSYLGRGDIYEELYDAGYYFSQYGDKWCNKNA